MAKMTKNQLIDAIAEETQVSKGDVKTVIEHMATVGYRELNEFRRVRRSRLCQNVGREQACY